MTPQEQVEFGARLAVLAEVYAEPMSPTRLEAYTQLLANESIDDLVPALEACAKICTFFPKPIDILDGIQTVRYERAQARTQKLLAGYVEPAREGITDAQVKMLAASMNERGITDRDDALAYVASVIGREVGSRKELTREEASRVIDSLLFSGDEVTDAEVVEP